jgi:hypothetical protein
MTDLKRFIVLVRHSHSEGFSVFGHNDYIDNAKDIWLKACLTAPIEEPLLVKRMDVVLQFRDDRVIY